MSNEAFQLKVSKQTEKAVAITVTVRIAGEKEQTRLAWFPKSIVGGNDGVASVPGRMLSERMADIRHEFQRFGLNNIKTAVAMA